MATLINTTDVALSELETAPGGGSPSDFSFEVSGRTVWSKGIRGAQQSGGGVDLFTWGFGDGTAAANSNPIFGITPSGSSNAPLLLGNWRGLQYWFDGTTFNITLKLDNTQTPSPPPFFNQAIDVQLVITDDSGNFSIFRQTPNSPPNYEIFFSVNAGQSQAQQQISGFQTDQYVLAKNLYWYIEVNGGPDFTGGTLEFNINTTNVLTASLPSGPFGGGPPPGTSEFFDWSGGFNQPGITNSGGIDLEFIIS